MTDLENERTSNYGDILLDTKETSISRIPMPYKAKNWWEAKGNL